MKTTYPLKILSKLLLLCSILFFVLPGLSLGETCITSKCHKGLARKPVVHQPVEDGDCLECHVRKSGKHPLPSGKSFGLSGGGSALCYKCHDSFGEQKFVHGPVASGDCIECHDPHASSVAALLKQGGRRLCLECHADFEEGVKEAKSIHPPVKKNDCTVCHDSHASEFGMLLKEKTPDFCFNCHEDIGNKFKRSRVKHKALYVKQKCANCHASHYSDGPGLLVASSEKDLCLVCHGKDDTTRSRPLRNIKKEIDKKKFLHGPVRKNRCAPCHDPHGERNHRLLRGPYPSSFYVKYRPGVFDFCLKCHNKNLLRFPDTTIYTKFRNGKLNLHYVHCTNRVKARTCRACHAPHAADVKKLIPKEGVPFGRWKIPINFVKTPTGGACTPGCHRLMKYDRKNPVQYSDDQTDDKISEEKHGANPPSKKKHGLKPTKLGNTVKKR